MIDQALRVFIVDDHPVVRRGLRTLLETAEMTVVGEAATSEDAVDAVLASDPDVVVMDLNLGTGRNGIDATPEITTAAPNVAVLVLTMLEDDDSVFAAMQAGARGYVLKGADQDDLVRSIVAVSRGEAIFGPAVAGRISRYFSATQRSALAFPQLTDRERRVLDLIAAGHSNIEIARHLGLAAKTIRNQVSNIFTKLQVSDRAAAVIRARDAGMGRGDRT